MQSRLIWQRYKRQLAGPKISVWRSLLTKIPPPLFLLILLTLTLTLIFLSSFSSTLSTSFANANHKPTPATTTTTAAAAAMANLSSEAPPAELHDEITRVKKKQPFHAATLNCSTTNTPKDPGNNQICRDQNYPTKALEVIEENREKCPEYFRWIHEDLAAWKEKGITAEMVEAARRTAHFRVVVKEGRVYVERYKKSIQTRDLFTIWGMVQLVRRYPGMVPDLDLMFDCDDHPVIVSAHYRRPNATGPPPLFRYCGDRWTHDIVFPDWSFWGWAEINIRPWEHLLEDMKKGNKMIEWKDREAYAYWKGNPFVAETRQDLLKCNVSDGQDWNARLFVQDWIKESQQGFNQSNLENQCTYRYKIYIEGYGWSVSEKYILACDSVTLLVKPRYHDFFIRSLQPTQHYWPIRDTDKCKSIKHAVDWGNNHKQKAQEIGKAARKFIEEELKMEYVYDYMFHLLSEYAKLLRFEPRVPRGAEEICAEGMVCTRSGLEKKFMSESMVSEPSSKAPCSLPPPFDPTSLRLFYGNKLNLIRRVERWEDNYWRQKNHSQPLI